MTEPGYVPRTSILGIYRSSYGLQLGEINNFLCIVIYRDKDIIDFKKFGDITLKSIINPDHVIGWLQNHFMIEINVRQISKTVRALISQLKDV